MARFIACPECDADVPVRSRQGQSRCPECGAQIRRQGADKESGRPWPLILALGGGFLAITTVVLLVVFLSGSKRGGNDAAEVVPLSGRPPAGWHEVKRPDFSVWMADGEEREPLTIDPRGGASVTVVQSGTFVIQSLDSAVLEPGKAAVSKTDPGWVYEQMVQLLVKRNKRIVSQRDIRVSGKLARDFELQDATNGTPTFVRMATANGTVYTLMVVGAGVRANDECVRLYFDSLRIDAGKK